MMGRNSSTRTARGFTLIEILIVVVILGILAALTVPHFGQATDEAAETAAHSQLNILRGQVTLYWAKHGSTTPMGNTVEEVVQTLTDQGHAQFFAERRGAPCSGIPGPRGIHPHMGSKHGRTRSYCS